MPVSLDMDAEGFEARFEVLLTSKREGSSDVDAIVAAIIDDVRKRGDEALADYSRRLDRVDLARLGVAVTEREIGAAFDVCDRAALRALELAHDRVLAYHLRQKPAD
ncbi:MAG: histidinol dehydrogenase, partial [Roseiarcus sp.]